MLDTQKALKDVSYDRYFILVVVFFLLREDKQMILPRASAEIITVFDS